MVVNPATVTGDSVSVESQSRKPFESYLYRDQVHAITNWFNGWSECEQTVTLYSLIKRLNFTQTKFLLTVLEQNLSLNKSQLAILESQANDPDHLLSINMTENSSIFQILSLLPLLRPNNEKASAAFVSLIPTCLDWSIKQDMNLEECRQLISYALIHPGLSNDQRGSLSHWLVSLDQRDTNSSSPPVSQLMNLTVSGDPWHAAGDSFNQKSRCVESDGEKKHPPLSSTLSAPAYASSSGGAPVGHQQYYSFVEKKSASRSKCSNAMPTPLSTSPDYDSSYGGSTGSLVESGLTETNSLSPVEEDRCGMRDVPSWLKSLRLHKYASLFSSFSYEEMLALDDEKLAQMKVTKGARHKIVLSINKLNERPDCLRQMERDVIECGGNIKMILNDLKQILVTPIKSYLTMGYHNTSSAPSGSAADDLPTLVCNVLAKLCSQILLHPDEDNCCTFLQMLDRCYTHEAFSGAQKQKILQWKTQCQRLSASSELKWSNRHYITGRRGSCNNMPSTMVPGNIGQGIAGYNRPLVHASVPSNAASLGSNAPGIIGTPPQRSSSGTNLNYIGNNCIQSQRHLQTYQPSYQPAMTSHSAVHRTQSSNYPGNNVSNHGSVGSQSPLVYYRPEVSRTNGYPSQQSFESASSAESMSRLESLCRSVADHALSNEFGAIGNGGDFGVSQ